MMKILLLSRNRVVKEMVRLAVEEARAQLECASKIDEIEGDRYSLLLVDSALLGELRLEDLEEHLLIGRKGVIASEEDTPGEEFDFRLSKPFLPSDILRIIDGNAFENAENEEEERWEDSSDVSARSEERGPSSTRILDRDEISKILDLLEETQSSAPSEAAPLLPEAMIQESQEEGREWIDRLLSMKPKRLKKLLKGAEVTITIRFPGEKG